VTIFIHLAIVAFQNREIARNSDKIWPYCSSKLSAVIDLGVNRKLVCDFLLVINTNFGPICYRFEILMLKARKWLNFPTHRCLRSRSGGTLRMSGWNLASEN